MNHENRTKSEPILNRCVVCGKSFKSVTKIVQFCSRKCSRTPIPRRIERGGLTIIRWEDRS